MTSANNLSRFSRSLWLTMAMFVVFAIVFAMYVYSEKQIDRANESRLQSRLLVDELRQSSDDLSHIARAYAATGNPVYKQHFQDIIDIRDGKKPRPGDYHNIYWDLMLTDDLQPVPDNGQTVALLELMRQAEFTGQEFAKLAQAKANSDALTGTEYAAMKLVEATTPPTETNIAQATLMLQSAGYNRAKAAVM